MGSVNPLCKSQDFSRFTNREEFYLLIMNAKLRKKCKVSNCISSKSQTPSSNQTEKSKLPLSVKIQKVQFTVKMPKSLLKAVKKRIWQRYQRRYKVQKLSRKDKICKQAIFFSSFPKIRVALSEKYSNKPILTYLAVLREKRKEISKQVLGFRQRHRKKIYKRTEQNQKEGRNC